MMKRMFISTLALTAALALFAGAQPPRGEIHNNGKLRLTREMRGIALLDRGSTLSLTRAQAARVVSLITPWRTRPHMTDGQAGALYNSINSTLTARQRAQLASSAPQRGPHGGGGMRPGQRFKPGSGPSGPGGMRPGGGPGMGGRPNPGMSGDMAQMRQSMKQLQAFFSVYNPFYPPTKYRELSTMPGRMGQSFSRRYGSLLQIVAELSQRAHKH